MGMKLTADDLRKLAVKLEALGTVEGVDLTQMLFNDHEIHLGKDGGEYYVRGASFDKAKSREAEKAKVDVYERPSFGSRETSLRR